MWGFIQIFLGFETPEVLYQEKHCELDFCYIKNIIRSDGLGNGQGTRISKEKRTKISYRA